MTKILIADDHPLIRAGLRDTLERNSVNEIVGEADNETDVKRLIEELLPDIVLLDIRMPDFSIVNTVQYIHKNFPEIKTIILSAYDDEIYVRSLIPLGIKGYILKEEVPETLIRAITAVQNGDTWFSHQIIEILAKPIISPTISEGEEHLTKRELEVLSLIAKGYANSQIADTLIIAEGTVKNHLVNIYQKLNLHSRAEAVSYAWKREIT